MPILRKIVIFLLLGLVALLIPGTIIRGLLPQLIAPNFLLMLLVYVAFYEKTAAGPLMAFLLGLELDISSGKLLGPWAGSYAIIFGLLILAAERLYIESMLVVTLAVFACSLLSSLVYHVILILVYGRQLMGLEVMSIALIEAGLTAFLSPFVFFLLKKLPLYRESSNSSRLQSVVN